MPKVSVVIPCYNQGRFLDDAVDSVLAQTYGDYEVVIVNDGSTDDATNRLLEGFRRPAARVIRTENQGVSMARNTGIRESSGTYILPLDADDRIGREYLERAVAVLDRDPDIGIATCRFRFFGDVNYLPDLPPFRPECLVVRNDLPVSSLFRRTEWEAVGGYNPEMRQGWEDWDFWLSLVASGVGVYRIPEVLFHYRIRKSSRERSLTREHHVRLYTDLYRNHREFFSRNIGVVFRELCQFRDLAGSRKHRLLDLASDPRLLGEKLLNRVRKTVRGEGE